MTFTEFGPNSRANVPEHNRLRGLDQGDPHPQYADATHDHAAADLAASVPRGVLGYAEVTANEAGITSADLTGLSVAVTVETSRRVRVTGYAARIDGTSAGDLFSLQIAEGGTTLNEAGVIMGTTFGDGVTAMAVLTPSAGEHTYKLVLARASGAGTATLIASANRPAFILVEDIGAA